MDKEKILKCKYPNCKKEGFFKHPVPSEDAEEDLVELDFCKYHFFIVMGGRFEALIDKEGEYYLTGPMEEVGIAEQVIAAREMILAEKTKA